MNGLTAADCSILVEALDEWIKKDEMGGMMGDLIGAMILGKDSPPDVRDKMEREKLDRQAKAKYEKQQRMEVATLLKAKLNYLRRDMESREFSGALDR